MSGFYEICGLEKNFLWLWNSMHLFFSKHPSSLSFLTWKQFEISIKLFTAKGVISHKNMALVVETWGKTRNVQQDTRISAFLPSRHFPCSITNFHGTVFDQSPIFVSFFEALKKEIRLLTNIKPIHFKWKHFNRKKVANTLFRFLFIYLSVVAININRRCIIVKM